MGLGQSISFLDLYLKGFPFSLIKISVAQEQRSCVCRLLAKLSEYQDYKSRLDFSAIDHKVAA